MIRDLMVSAVSELGTELGSSECGGDSYCSGTLIFPVLGAAHDSAATEIGSELQELLENT